MGRDRRPDMLLYIYFLFNSDFVNYLLRTNGGGRQKASFVIFIVWSASIIGGWVVAAWSTNSYLGPSEIASFVILDLLKDGGWRVSPPMFHFFVSDVNHGNEEAFSFVTLWMERFSLDLLRAVKK